MIAAVIVERTENPIGCRMPTSSRRARAGSGVLVDCNDVADPLFERIESDGVRSPTSSSPITMPTT